MSEIFSTCDFYGGEPNLGFTPKMKLPTVLHYLSAGFSPEYMAGYFLKTAQQY